MLIDWFTVVAQVINFLILAGLLYWFLFRPISSAMDERERRLTERWEQAEAAQHKAEHEAQALARQRKEWDQQRQSLLAEARSEAENLRRELSQQVRSDAAQMRSRWQQTLRDEADSFLRDMRRQVAEQAVQIARQALEELAGEDVERRMLHAAMRRLEELDERDRDQLARALRSGDDGAVVATAFPFDEEVKGEITAKIRSLTNVEGDIHFETNPELICGVEIRAGTYKLAWAVGDYLDSLTQSLSAALEEEMQSAGVDAKPSLEKSAESEDIPEKQVS